MTMATEEQSSANFLVSKRTNFAAARTDMAKERTELAINRTVMAANRTLMGWIRTGLSMLGFGFTIYKFIIYLEETIPQSVVRPQGPRRLGVFLISLATMSIIFGLIDYYITFKRLGKSCSRSPWSFVFFVGVISVLLGLFLVFTIVMHKEII